MTNIYSPPARELSLFASIGAIQRKFTVSEAPQIRETNMKQQLYTWSEFVGRLKKPSFAPVTRDEVSGLLRELKDLDGQEEQGDLPEDKKTRKGKIKAQLFRWKDSDYFVAGVLRGSRSDANVVSLSLVALDYDDIPQGEKFDMEQHLPGIASVTYSTFKSTRLAPRYRVVVPVDRDMSPDEARLVKKWVMQKIPFSVDKGTLDTSRAMFFPRIPKDGASDFEFYEAKGGALIIDEVLKEARLALQDKHDARVTGVSRQRSIFGMDKVKRDPATIPGHVGQFCRAFTVEDAIECFLSHIYVPAGHGKYTHTKSDSPAGLYVLTPEAFIGNFAYSHHTNVDPASDGRAHNAFDLVRIHLFGDKDLGSDAPVGERPSDIAMKKWMEDNETVQKRLREMKEKQLAEEFGEYAEEGGEASGKKWSEALTRDKKGNVENKTENRSAIVENDPVLQAIKYNTFSNEFEVTDGSRLKAPGTNIVNDLVLAYIVAYLEHAYGLRIAMSNVFHHILAHVVKTRPYNPVKEFIEAQPWDGKRRLDTALIDYLGADDSPYTRAVTRKWFTAAVARVYAPGCKFDHVLTLSGPEGIGKSVFFGTVGGRWYSDGLSLSDDSKTQKEKIRDAWVVEIGELAGMRKAEVESAKSLITATCDKYRPAYARTVEHFPRHSVLAATTNEEFFLRSTTGDRRWWVVSVLGNGRAADWLPRLQEAVPQLWAEALALYKKGEKLFLEDDLEREARRRQSAANIIMEDGLRGVIEAWLDVLLPSNWDDYTMDERRLYFRNLDENSTRGNKLRQYVCVAEILKELPVEGMAKYTSNFIGKILDSLEGWERASQRPRLGAYGQQRVWRRKDTGEAVPQLRFAFAENNDIL